MRRGSGSSLARAQSGIPTGNSDSVPSFVSGGDGPPTFSFASSPMPSSSAGAAPPMSFAVPSSASASASASPFPSFSFASSTSPSASSPAGFSFASSAPMTSSHAPSSAPPSFTFPSQSSPQQSRAAQIGPPAPYAHGGPPTGGEQAWEPNFKREHKDESPFGNLLRCTTAILNKIGPRNFDPMVRELAEHVTGRCLHDGKQGMCGNGITEPQQLEMFSRVIFEKALEEPNFSDLYAHVCHAITPLLPRFDDSAFEFYLGTLCDSEVGDYLEFEDLGEDSSEGEEEQLKRRMLGNLKFAAELYNTGVLTTNDLMSIIDCLAEQESTAELCCHVMRHAGRMLDFRNEEAVEHGKIEPPFYHSREEALEIKPYIESIYRQLAKYLEGRQLPARVNFMLQDLLEERYNNWQKLPPSVPQQADEPPRKPPITVRRSLSGKPAASPAQQPSAPAAAANASPPKSRAALAAAAAAAAASSPTRSPHAATSPGQPNSPQPAARSVAGPAAVGNAAAVAASQAKREQVRLIADSIVRPLKEALQWADDNERRMDAQNLRTQTRVEDLNRAFLLRVSEALERLQRQLGEVPFLQNLVGIIGAYASDTVKKGGERAPYHPANIARLKATLVDKIGLVEQAFNSSAKPGGATSAPPPSAGTPPSAAAAASAAPRPAPTTHQPPPLAAASALAHLATGAGPAREQPARTAPAQVSEPPPDWLDPDLHQLTAGQPLEKLLRRWEEELAGKAAELNRRAQLLASFDKVCVGLDRSMSDLLSNIDQVSVAQKEVDQGLDVILRHQESFHDLLCNLEREAEATLTEVNVDQQRERGYDAAKEVDSGLREVESELRCVIEEFNDLLVSGRTGQEHQAVELEEILNNSLNALQWMSVTGGYLERKLRRIQRLEAD